MILWRNIKNYQFLSVLFKPQISPIVTISKVQNWGNFCTEMFPRRVSIFQPSPGNRLHMIEQSGVTSLEKEQFSMRQRASLKLKKALRTQSKSQVIIIKVVIVVLATDSECIISAEERKNDCSSFQYTYLLAMLSCGCYFENMPMQNTVIYFSFKNDNFQLKNVDIILIFALKHRLWVHVRTSSFRKAVLTSTHDLCLRAKI